MRKFDVLYDDKSGIFGYWYFCNIWNSWRFHKTHPTVSLSDEEMRYLLKELAKIKRLSDKEEKVSKK